MASFKLKRKTYAILGIGNVAKNWKAGGMLNKAKAIGTGTLYGAAGVGALGTAGAYKAGGGDLLSGGEKSAKEMDF